MRFRLCLEVYFVVYFANHHVRKGFSTRSFWSFLGNVNQHGRAGFGACSNCFYRFYGRGGSSTSWGEAFFVF